MHDLSSHHRNGVMMTVGIKAIIRRLFRSLTPPCICIMSKPAISRSKKPTAIMRINDPDEPGMAILRFIDIAPY